jgi:hypothetical protein
MDKTYIQKEDTECTIQQMVKVLITKLNEIKPITELDARIKDLEKQRECLIARIQETN